ncbi:MAG TPA: GNAT family N-acetyltransferase [Lacipirellulaceae bacterium]|jgi:predicted N-acetyltransferase YhbS|nr:GNAT family N-acetyltransferase [Lacipirellulaceae bacterium]
MQIETIDRRTIREPDARAIAELLVSIWPKPGRTVETRTDELLSYWRNYTGPEPRFPRSLVVRDNGRVTAHADASPRTVKVPGHDLTVLALARVCTTPETRGQGLGHALVKKAFELVDDGVYLFALFQTKENVRPFYEKLGAAVAPNRFYNAQAEDPEADPFWDPVIMFYPNHGNWPAADIDINGPGW